MNEQGGADRQMECKRGIAVLMAVYNGEKYLPEQLDSLMSQTCQDFEIFIHDDNSSDGTREILKKYISLYEGRIHLLNDYNAGRGAKGSFEWLLSSVDAAYYMFCDQDDVWLSQKIENSLSKIRSVEKDFDGPVMIHTDLKIVDSGLNVIHDSMWRFSGYMPDLMRKFEYTCINNVFTGCTMIINRAARDLSLPFDPRVPMHDWWIGLKVTKSGKVDNIKEPTILYRQHDDNVCSTGPEGKLKLKGSKLFRLMERYNRDAAMLGDLGFGRAKAIRYKILYSIHRIIDHMKGE